MVQDPVHVHGTFKRTGVGSGTCNVCRTYSRNCNIFSCNVCGRKYYCCFDGVHSQSIPGKCSPCSTCGGGGTTLVRCVHGQTNAHNYSTQCSDCNGVGNLRNYNLFTWYRNCT